MKHLIGTINDIPKGRGKMVKVNGICIAVFHTYDDRFYAIADTCSHAQASLSKGYLQGTVIECPRHGATFDITTGKNLTLPAVFPVKHFDLIIDGEKLFVEI